MVIATVFYRVRKINGKYYLYREWWDPETGKRKSKCLGNCEKIESMLAGPRGFEPRTPGLEGRCPILARPRALSTYSLVFEVLNFILPRLAN